MFQTQGTKAKPILISQMAGEKGPMRDSARRKSVIAKCHSCRRIIPKSWLKANSPIESKVNQYMISLASTVLCVVAASDIRCSRTAICRSIRGRYELIAINPLVNDTVESRIGFQSGPTTCTQSGTPDLTSSIMYRPLACEDKRTIWQHQIIEVGFGTLCAEAF